MKKLIIVNLVLLLSCFESISQVNDTIKLTCSYKLKYSKNLNDISNKKYAKMTLDIGTNYSKFYSKDYQKKDSLYYWDSQVFSGTELLARKEQYIKRTPPYIILKNISNIDSLYYFSKIISEYYQYNEKPVFNWNLTNESDTIIGYHCLKATCKYAGREYIAWFTTEIPVSDGPWKFFGTPGLILSVADTEGHYSFECVGIKNVKKTKARISILDRDYLKCSRVKFNKLNFRCMQDPISFINSKGDITVKRRSPIIKKSKFDYNPIELE